MTRRSFLQNIAGALAVLALPVAVKAAAKERLVRWEVDPDCPRFNFINGEFVRVPSKLPLGIPNPAYVSTPYEMVEYKWEIPTIFTSEP